MGHIELAVPVSHIWFYKCMPSRIGLMLDMSARMLERVIYYEDFIVIDPGTTPLELGQLLTEVELREAEDEYGEVQTSYGVNIDDLFTDSPAVGTYTSVTGIVNYSYGEFKICPRTADDVVQ